MVEAQTWTTRRMSNPKLDSTATADHEVLDIPVTPTADVRNNIYTVGSHLSPNLLTALIIASCPKAAHFVEEAVPQDLCSERHLLFLCGVREHFLKVLGNAKAALAASVSVMIFRNPVTVMGMTGFAVTIMGVVLYSEAKKRSKAQLAAH
ncbi:hypothetical protein F3Y22_tig00111166pilonHSYRG00090 [Hibiscus syriacus]|uniref:Sugar phosphate transporter domain-containing protein n=1 Tax=Hibiscus syriacus TaxID=106335 RepID=A0A6A2YXU3_HIBSY|nr:hypothetical protein F3Y22_tig00111166pilonHSYRG00090 [Hibiscus syriacus]